MIQDGKARIKPEVGQSRYRKRDRARIEIPSVTWPLWRPSRRSCGQPCALGLNEWQLGRELDLLNPSANVAGRLGVVAPPLR